jgi:selenocysteine lyase/cysteine desulfurase
MTARPFEPPARRRFLASLGASTVAAAVPLPATLPRGRPIDASEYLLETGLVYLNTGSLGPASRAVLDRTVAAWQAVEANPVFQSYGSGPAHVATDAVRQRAAALIGCVADELLFTRSTTEAMNSVALGISWKPGDRVLTTDQEHEGGELCWKHVARRFGVAIDRVPVGPMDAPGAIVDRFTAAWTGGTRVVSVSHLITTTGLRMPIADIAALARARGALCVVDGAQALGHVKVDVRALGVHAYAASGHKWLLGPKGTGLLYVGKDAEDRIQPVQREEGRRFVAASIGIGSLPLVAGLGAAVEAIERLGGIDAVERGVMALRARVYDGLRALPTLTMASPPPGPLGTGLVAAQVPSSIPSDVLRDRLRVKHRVIVKMVEKRWFNGIRLSAHVFNTEADIDAALAALRIELG